MLVPIAIISGCVRALFPGPPDVAATARSPKVTAARAATVPAVDVEFERLEPAPASGTSIDDHCASSQRGIVFPSWSRVKCFRIVTRYYGTNGAFCADLLRTVRALGWRSPPNCDGTGGAFRRLPGAPAHADLRLQESQRPLAPFSGAEQEITPPGREGTVRLEYRGVDLPALSTRILRDHPHVLSISFTVVSYISPVG
ncbi:hypothetical protein ACQP1W_30405 [Spirillospora sp. CA-255316]